MWGCGGVASRDVEPGRVLIGHGQAMRDDDAKSRALTRWPIGGSIIEGAESTRLVTLPKFQKEWSEISY